MAKKETKSFILLHSIGIQELSVQLFFALLILLIFRITFLPYFQTQYLGSGYDSAYIYHYITLSFWQALKINNWFNLSAFYPFSSSLAFNDCYLLPSLLTAALRGVGLSEVSSYNTTLFLAQLLNGFFSAFLVYSLTASRKLSLLASLATLSLPFFVVHVGQPHLLWFFFLPLSIWLLLKFFESLALKFIPLITIALMLTFLSSIFYYITFTLALLIIFLGIIFLRPKYLKREKAIVFGALLILGQIILIPFLLPYFNVSAIFNESSIHQAYFFSASWTSYLSSAESLILYGSALAPSEPEFALLPSFTLLFGGLYSLTRLSATYKLKVGIIISSIFLALASFLALGSSQDGAIGLKELIASLLLWVSLICFIVVLKKLSYLEQHLGASFLTDRSILGIFLFCALFFYVVSLGPLYHPEHGIIPLSPYALFFYLLPSSEVLVFVCRSAILVHFFLLLSLILFLKSLPKKNALLITLTCGILIFMENFPVFHKDSYRPNYISEAAKNLSATRKLQDINMPSGTSRAFVSLPFPRQTGNQRETFSYQTYNETSATPMIISAKSGLKTVNGYDSRIHSKLSATLLTPTITGQFPDKASLLNLKQFVGLKYVLFNLKDLAAGAREEFNLRLVAYQDQVRILQRISDQLLLLELIGEIPIEDINELFIPSKGVQAVYLKLKCSSEATSLGVILEDHSKSNMVIARLKLEAGQSIHIVPIPHPIISDNVRPLKIKFEISSETGEIKLVDAAILN